MKRNFIRFLIAGLITLSNFTVVSAQVSTPSNGKASVATAIGDSLSDEALDNTGVVDTASTTTKTTAATLNSGGYHQKLKTKFIEGNAGFMSLVAIALVLGLAFCIERIIYLSLSEIDAIR